MGRYDNFFALGGDSLLATQVIARLIKEFGFDIPILTIFQYPTLSGLAGAISQNQLNTEEEQELSALLTEIENLSEEEAEKRLTSGED